MELPVQILFQNCLDRLGNLYDDREAKSIIKMLLEDRFGISAMDQMINKIVSVDEKKLNSTMARLEKMEPVQYVTGVAGFFGRKFKVQSGVLIPRPETEELVSWMIESNDASNPVIWDIGTGSGCISISLDLGIPDSKTIGTDFSASAIGIAEANNSKLGSDVQFIRSDIFEDDPSAQVFNIIVSNPPYIPKLEKSLIHQNVLGHEPGSSLFVPNDNPLVFYLRIAEVALKKLKNGGSLFFEIHENYGSDICRLLETMGYQKTEIKKDMQGKDRMVRAGKFLK